MVRRLYEPYAHPLTRIVQGVPASWDPVIAAVKCPHEVRDPIWSPCSGFIAIDGGEFAEWIQILDAATLKRVKSLVPHEARSRLLTLSAESRPLTPSAGSRSPTYVAGCRSLTFSTESRLLTQFSGDSEMFISWDLQTGAPASIIYPHLRDREWGYPEGSSIGPRQLSITHSGCGTMFGVLFSCHHAANIVTYNTLSGESIGHFLVEKPVVRTIWIHDKSIRFATYQPGSITIWEVGFDLDYPATEVKSLPTPNNFNSSKEFLFLPTRSRLAFVHENSVFVWDAQHLKFLLSSADIEGPRQMTFSSGGRFFACGTNGQQIYLWKDSSTGYTLHRKLMSSTGSSTPLLSPDGRSILVFSGSTLQLFHTTDSTTPLSSVPAQAFEHTAPFVLGFSPGESLVATARLWGNTATVLDLGSGVPRLTVDAGMKIYGLRVAERTVVVVGDGKVITWNLPQRDHVPNATANINDSIRTTIYDRSSSLRLLGSASISPDFDHIAATGMFSGESMVLNIYDVTTGKYLGGTPTSGSMPWFTPDGREVWCRAFISGADGWAIVKDDESNFLKMECLGPAQYGPEVLPWTTSRGYKIADDGWVLGSSGKRLLWLPPQWQSEEMDRIWNGRFLALFHHQLPEVVILEVPEE